jgi:hypothetical protein
MLTGVVARKVNAFLNTVTDVAGTFRHQMRACGT